MHNKPKVDDRIVLLCDINKRCTQIGYIFVNHRGVQSIQVEVNIVKTNFKQCYPKVWCDEILYK